METEILRESLSHCVNSINMFSRTKKLRHTHARVLSIVRVKYCSVRVTRGKKQMFVRDREVILYIYMFEMPRDKSCTVHAHLNESTSGLERFAPATYLGPTRAIIVNKLILYERKV